MVVAQATYLVGTRLGPTAEASFLRALGDFHVEPPYPEDWTLTADLVDSYADLPLGGTDAATVALAARIDATTAITLDRRQLSAIRPPHCPAFRIPPE